MKNYILMAIFFLTIVTMSGFISAACSGSQPSDYCLGSKVYKYECNGTDWVYKLKGDCAISGKTCRNAVCVDLDECETNSECNDDNPCTIDSCVGETNKRCENQKKDGCIFENNCIDYGTRVSSENTKEYCNYNDELLQQKNNQEDCSNNYECQSNLCISGKCLESSETNSDNNTLNFIFSIVIIILILELIELIYKRKK